MQTTAISIQPSTVFQNEIRIMKIKNTK